jgi:type IV pilus assembly protein PilZ
MKLPILLSVQHQGKYLIVDADRETIDVHEESGHVLGSIPWTALVEQVLSGDEDTRFAHYRSHQRAPLAVKVRYTTPEGKQCDSLTGGIGGGGLFIESGAPLAPGTELAVEFALPDRPWEKLKAKGRVVWTRKKSERYLLFPGMGVQFTDIDGKAQSLLVDLVDALNRSRAQS